MTTATTKQASLTLSQEITRRLNAGYGGVLVTTREQQACYEEIRRAGHPTYRWSIASGLLRLGENAAEPTDNTQDPADLLRGLPERLAIPAKTGAWNGRVEEDSVVILADIGPFLKDAVLERLMLETVWWARSAGVLLVVIQKTDALPDSLKGEISFLEHSLPTREATRARVSTLLDQQLTEKKYAFDVPTEAAIDNLMGMTSFAQENAVALAIGEAKAIKGKSLNVATLRKLKEEEIGKRPYLKVIDPKITMDDLIGHEELKKWAGTLKGCFSQKARDAGVKPPKGVAFAGPPGTGKTRMAEGIAGTYGFPILLFDVASAYSSHLGETEANFADALAIAEACAPCILLVDEVERMFPGGSSGERDGGTSERVLGKFLTWTATKEASVFLVFTSNYPQNVPPALMRKGRLDEVFCLDLPTDAERAAIWMNFIKKCPIGTTVSGADSVEVLVQASVGYSGAEIESIVDAAIRTAFSHDTKLNQADILAELNLTKPLSQTMGAEVAKMQQWAQVNARKTTSVCAAPSPVAEKPRKVK